MVDRRHAKATKHDSRRSNLKTTLELVSSQGATSRAEIARRTGLSRAAVSSLVNELIDQNLLRELGQGESAGGKPPTLLALNEKARDIVTIDLGHRPFAAALVDLSGRLHTRAQADLVAGQPTGADAVESAASLIGEMISQATAPVLGIGVGVPGVIEFDGRVLEASNLAWHGFDLGAELRSRFDIPVSIANDASMAALAEFRRHPTDRNLILIKLGNGVGSGLVLNGSVFRGQHSAAGEIGHVRLGTGGLPCRCGHNGCLETVASIPAILRRLGADPETTEWDALALAGAFGETVVREALVEAGRAIGTAMASVVAALDVAHVVLAPELLNGSDILVEVVREELSSRILPSTAEMVEVEATQLGGDLVLMGAASAVLVDRLGAVLR
ncbi:MAG TPA: ROK family transcriptional regulator [Acidimicrobiia bacterium]|nr:ROK family transcriptional regulator [Acidimicrobiia bacterium]